MLIAPTKFRTIIKSILLFPTNKNIYVAVYKKSNKFKLRNSKKLMFIYILFLILKLIETCKLISSLWAEHSLKKFYSFKTQIYCKLFTICLQPFIAKNNVFIYPTDFYIHALKVWKGPCFRWHDVYLIRWWRNPNCCMSLSEWRHDRENE